MKQTPSKPSTILHSLKRHVPQTDANAIEAQKEFTIDELAREASSTVRNVRAYQDRGLLPPPEKRGRTGIYTDVHLARLKIIGALLERGFTINNIRDLLVAWQEGSGGSNHRNHAPEARAPVYQYPACQSLHGVAVAGRILPNGARQ